MHDFLTRSFACSASHASVYYRRRKWVKISHAHEFFFSDYLDFILKAYFKRDKFDFFWPDIDQCQSTG